MNSISRSETSVTHHLQVAFRPGLSPPEGSGSGWEEEKVERAKLLEMMGCFMSTFCCWCVPYGQAGGTSTSRCHLLSMKVVYKIQQQQDKPIDSISPALA